MQPTGLWYHALATAVLIVHALFVVFVVLGAFLAWRWRWVAWVHVPAAVWGVAIEFGGWICPLTPLENALRGRAGLAGYSGGFVEHHLTAWLYPIGLTPPTQGLLGALALLVNVAAYGLMWRRTRHRALHRC